MDVSLWTVAVAWISGRGSKLSRDSRIDCHSVSEVGQFLTLSDDTRSCFTRRGQIQGHRFPSVQMIGDKDGRLQCYGEGMG